MIHFLQNIIKYLLEKIIAYGIKDLLHKLTQCIMYKTMEFFKKDIQNQVSQIWLYLNNIEVMICKIFIDLPITLTFIFY